MRSLFFAGIALIATFAFAHESVRAEPTTHATEDAQRNAATTALRSMFFESGIFEAAIAEFAERSIPETRARAEQSGARARLSERGRAAFDQYIEDLPDALRQELNLSVGELIEHTAQRSAHIFTVAEWNGIAEFFAEPAAQTAFVKLSRGDRASITEEEMAVALRFFETPAGHAFATRGDQFNAALAAVVAEELPRITASVEQRSFRHLCEALADECPTHIREQARYPI